MENTLVTPREIVKTVYDSFTTEQVKEAIQRIKPEKIFNIQYSSVEPLYVITSITDEGVFIYSGAWAVKEPKYYSWEEFRHALRMSGMENVRF